MKNLIQSVLILNAVFMSAQGAEEVIYAQVGERISFKPPGINPHKYLYWNFDQNVNIAWRNALGGSWVEKDDMWKNTLSLSGDSLIVWNITQKHFGTYVGKLSDKGNDKNAETITYKVLKLTVAVNPPSPLLHGEFMSLICNTETPYGYRKPQIHWLNPKGEEIKNTRGPLTVRATGQHNGQWTCVVTNDKKEHRPQISVTVVDLSPAPSHPQYTSTSWPLTIPCSIPEHISWEQIKAKGFKDGSWHFYPRTDSSLISGDPQRLFSLSVGDSVTWNKDQDRKLTPVGDLKKGNLTLTRNRGREGDSGDYVCSLKFNNVTLNRTIQVQVLQISSSPRTDLISGQQVNLTCGFGHPLTSDLRLKWFPPEQSSRSSLTSDRRSTHLTIPEVGTGDGGKWRCELWRKSTRLTSAVITLKIEPRLSVWMLVIICSVSVIVILLLILVFIIFRCRQRKTRHLRHRLCQCKNPKPKGFYRT